MSGRVPPARSYRAIQERLKGGAKVPARKDINRDFALRGFIVCGGCGRPLHGCWSKGRNRSYPYYLRVQKGCPDYGKSIKRETIEHEFGALPKGMRPAHSLFAIMHDMVRDIWESQTSSLKDQWQVIETELDKTERGIAQLVDGVMETDNATLIAAYEKRIRDLEAQKIELRESITRLAQPVRDFTASFRTAMKFLSNPYNYGFLSVLNTAELC